jgi:hypothetical protein
MSGTAPCRTVVHLGYPKCASTYLQKEVFPRLGNFANFGNLSGSGVSFEERAILYHRDMDSARFREAVERRCQPGAACRPFRILSSENYVELPFAGFERNFGRIPRAKGIDLTPYEHSNERICGNLFRVWPDACILIIIREPLSWAVSRYDHWYRRDLVDQSLDECLDTLSAGYDRLVQLYIDRFGRDRVNVVPYELLIRDSAAFLREVTGFIDPEFSGSIPNIRTNSVPSSAAEVEQSRLGYRLKHNGLLRGTGLAGILNPLLQPYCRWKYGTGIQKSAVSAATADRLRLQLRASNSRLEKLTGLNLGALGYDVEPAA